MNPAFGYAVLFDEFLAPFVEAKAWVLQIDGIYRVRHRDQHMTLCHWLFCGEPHYGRYALAGASLVDPVEVDEIHRIVAPATIRDTTPEARADERQMGVGVGRLDCPLSVRKFFAQVELVVFISSPLWEYVSEKCEVRAQAVVLSVQPRSEALIEIPGGGVIRAIERLWKSFEHISMGV